MKAVFTGAGGPIPSGATRSYTVETSGRFNRLSLVTMLVNTNDAFTGLDRARLRGNGSSHETMAYDSGSERNNELKSHIPGPCCGNAFVRDPEGALIGPHEGITGRGAAQPGALRLERRSRSHRHRADLLAFGLDGRGKSSLAPPGPDSPCFLRKIGFGARSALVPPPWGRHTIAPCLRRPCSGGRSPRSAGRTSATRSWSRRSHGCAAGPSSRATSSPASRFVVAAHDEEAVIERRLANLLALDYPRDKLELVAVSDASTDRTDELVESVAAEHPRVRLLRVPRGGKVAAQDHAVRATGGEILAFSDANTLWRPDAMRKLVRNFADPEVAYVCGAHFYEGGAGTNREGTVCALRGLAAAERVAARVDHGRCRTDLRRPPRATTSSWIPRFGHDLALPYRLVQRGRRAVVEPEAIAWEKPARDIEDEFRRKIRMFEHCWLILLQGGMLRGLGTTYRLQLVSHRHLRYASGILHLLLLASSLRARADSAGSIGRRSLRRSRC